MARNVIPVLAVEFHDDGNTIWVHGLNGTVLRIKTLGKILTDQCTTNPCSHTDIVVKENIKICLSGDVED
jgi:hypothetical protein